jgi:hypothetical protein
VSIREIYPLIIDSFKHYATLSTKKDNIYMSYHEMLDFIRDCKIIDGSFTRLDYDIIFKAINYNEQESDINPQNGVVRHEFIEAIVRIAVEKYMHRGSAPDELSAVQ